MLSCQRALFDIPREVCFFNAATYSPLPIAVQEAGHEVVVLPLYPAPGGGVRHGTFARFRPVAVLPPALCDAPTAAPSLSASDSRIWKFSALPMPRPPETMMRAAVSSGRSDLVTS